MPAPDGHAPGAAKTVSAVREAAPAKINLALHTTGRRPDSYHLLDSLVVFSAFGDEVEVARAEQDSFSVSGPFASSVPDDASNLVLRAKDALQAIAPASPTSIRLTKNLPVASGVGGGSSDAAAALRALVSLQGLTLSAEQLRGIAFPLGADLPMCLTARPLRARGIGEQIDLIENMPALHLVLVNPGVEVSTPAVFKKLARPDNPPMPALPAHISFKAMLGWLALTRNDLEAPALAIAPAITEALSALRANHAAFARMSGSGATCFGLFETASAAMLAAENIRALQPNWFTAATQTTV